MLSLNKKKFDFHGTDEILRVPGLGIELKDMPIVSHHFKVYVHFVFKSKGLKTKCTGPVSFLIRISISRERMYTLKTGIPVAQAFFPIAGSFALLITIK